MSKETNKPSVSVFTRMSNAIEKMRFRRGFKNLVSEYAKSPNKAAVLKQFEAFLSKKQGMSGYADTLNQESNVRKDGKKINKSGAEIILDPKYKINLSDQIALIGALTKHGGIVKEADMQNLGLRQTSAIEASSVKVEPEAQVVSSKEVKPQLSLSEMLAKKQEQIAKTEVESLVEVAKPQLSLAQMLQNKQTNGPKLQVVEAESNTDLTAEQKRIAMMAKTWGVSEEDAKTKLSMKGPSITKSNDSEILADAGAKLKKSDTPNLGGGAPTPKLNLADIGAGVNLKKVATPDVGSGETGGVRPKMPGGLLAGIGEVKLKPKPQVGDKPVETKTGSNLSIAEQALTVKLRSRSSSPADRKPEEKKETELEKKLRLRRAAADIDPKTKEVLAASVKSVDGSSAITSTAGPGSSQNRGGGMSKE
jgi:hypothetical protein